jgi:hypothetical protein
MRIVASTAQTNEVVPEGTYTFELRELRGPQPRDYTNSAGDPIHIDQSFRMGVKVVDGDVKGRMAWDTVDADGPMGWRFVSLADACLAKKHKKGDNIETETLLGRKFVATLKHGKSKDPEAPFTNLINFVPAPTEAARPKLGGIAPTAKRL